MVFFRFNKIDKGDRGAADKLEELGSKKADGRSTEAAGGGSTSSQQTASETEPLIREKEKHEKKKKSKHTDDSEPSGIAGGADSSTAVPGSLAAGGATRCLDHPLGLSVNDFISKTKNQQRQGLKPSGPELIAYARYLGIDPVADHDLLWIAVEALEAPLPSEWTEHFDHNDRVFYYNASVRVSSWTHPLEHIYRETYKSIVNYRNANMSSQERVDKLSQLKQEVKQMETDVQKEIAQWTEHADEQGNRFYFNREERQSTWTDPRPAKCQILHLRMKTLRLLDTGSGASSGLVGECKVAAESKEASESKADVGSRFAPLVGSNDLEAPGAFKRPKVGGARVAAEGYGFSSLAASNQSGRAETLDTTAQDLEASSITAPVTSDSDNEEDDRRRKKKKKKKREKKHREAEKPQISAGPSPNASARPPVLGQNLRGSASEPVVGGGKPLLGNMDDSRSMTQQTLSKSPFDHAEGAAGLSNVGRVHVKAGIRLDPIVVDGVEGVHRQMPQLGLLESPGNGMDLGTPKGVRSSASVPALQP